MLKCVVFTEPPATISKPIMDISVPEKEKVTFECEVSRSNADVTWLKVRRNRKKELFLNTTVSKMFPHLKGDVELKPGKNLGIHSLGRKRTLVINKCSPEDAGTYICRTTDDNTSAKLTVNGIYCFTAAMWNCCLTTQYTVYSFLCKI